VKVSGRFFLFHPARRWVLAPLIFAIALGASGQAPDAADAFARGREQFRTKDFAGAAATFERLVIADPKNSKYHQWFGRALGLQAQQKGIAKSILSIGNVRGELEQAVMLDPDNLEARIDLIIFYRSVPGFLGGSRSKADEQLAEIRRRDASLASQIDGDIFALDKKPVEAEGAYLKAIRANPARPMPYVRLALVQQYDKKWEAAFASLQRALAIDPKHPLAIYQVGRTGALSGERLELAEQALKRYLQLKPDLENPSMAAAHYRLGMVYQKKRDEAAACSEYETSLKLEPKNNAVREALQSLK
jgi:tetratricopeptide (TPR) repeat protein